MTNIIVTELEYHKASHVFKNVTGFACVPSPADEPSLARKIKTTGAKYVIIGVDNYTGELYDALPAGGVIARFGVGHDGVNKALAKSNGIYCANTPGVLDDSVAECAAGLMLTAARHIAACAADNRNGSWKNRVGVELSGKTLAVIGCGNIGRKVARIAKAGFGMRVIGCDVAAPKDMSAIDDFTTDFTQAARDADFVSVHIPDIPATKNFINAERLATMKPSAILINTARGGVVDESAVYDAAKSGVIAGAALDVFKTEPYAPQAADKDLRTLSTIIMTPHIGSSTVEACERMARAALRNIEHAENGSIQEMNLVVPA